MRSAAWACVLGVSLGPSVPAAAQQVTVSTPYHAVGDSFFENMGTSWGLGGRNWNLNVFGSPNQAAPQFGGFAPSAGANFGFGFGGGGLRGGFGGNFSQGSRRSFVSQTPSVTLQNGMFGGISDTSQSPFVISYIPVVGGFPTIGSVLPAPPRPPQGTLGGGSVVQQALQRAAAARQQPNDDGAGRIDVPRPQVVRMPPPAAADHDAADDLVLGGGPAKEPGDRASRDLGAAGPSSASRPAMSVAEARRLHEAEQAGASEEATEYLERASRAEAAGKPAVAKIYYQMAYRRASGALRGQIQARLNALDSSP